MDEHIRKSIIDGMKHKKIDLSLANKGLTYIPIILRESSNFQRIFLQNNAIEKIENLDGCQRMLDLVLRNNKISKIENLNGLQNLERVYLAHNMIERITKNSLPSNILRVDLSNNPIKQISENALPDDLEELDLRNTKLSTIPKSLEKLNIPIFLDKPKNGKRGVYVGGNQFSDAILSRFSSNVYISGPSANNYASIKKSPRSKKTEIYFSYAWNDKDDLNNIREHLVDNVHMSLKSDSFNVIREKEVLSYADPVSKFMRKLGESKLVLIFLSDKYFKSSFCMYELIEIARNSKWDKYDFLSRVIPIPIDGIDFIGLKAQHSHYKFWKEKVREKELQMQSDLNQITSNLCKEYLIAKEIKDNILKLMEWLKDVNYKSLDELRNDDFDQLKKTILERMKG